VRSGALLLLEHKQDNSGGDLALQLLDCYTKSKQKLTPDILQTIRTLFEAFSCVMNDDAKVSFIKAAIHYSEKFGSSTLGEPALHLMAARFYQSRQEYLTSHKHFLRSNQYNEHTTMLLEWSSKGFKSEIDLFLARAVLQYLCLENLAGANAVFDLFIQKIPSLDTPLVHFIQFLLKTVERDAGPLFQMLRQKYAQSLERDPAFNAYLNKIGEVYFGIKSSGGVLSNLFDLTKGLL